MKTCTEEAIKSLIEIAKESKNADSALKYSQAALNLAHTINIVHNIK